jgi:hypothetical protein
MLLFIICVLHVNAQVKHIVYLEDTINGSGRNKIATNISRSEIQYLYKTVYVDSTKIWTQFDTLILPPLNNYLKFYVIDEFKIFPSVSRRDYNNIACFQLYYDSAINRISVKKLIFSTVVDKFIALGNGTTTIGTGTAADTIKSGSILNIRDVHLGSLVQQLNKRSIYNQTTANYTDSLNGAGTGKIVYGNTTANKPVLTLSWTIAPAVGDSLLFSYTKIGLLSVNDSLYVRSLFWETLPTNKFNTSNQNKTFLIPVSVKYWGAQNFSFLTISQTLNWVSVNSPGNQALFNYLFPNRGLRFNCGDFLKLSGGQNWIGNKIFKVVIKYHIETIN